jgi:hypothetical protein
MRGAGPHPIAGFRSSQSLRRHRQFRRRLVQDHAFERVEFAQPRRLPRSSGEKNVMDKAFASDQAGQAAPRIGGRCAGSRPGLVISSTRDPVTPVIRRVPRWKVT